MQGIRIDLSTVVVCFVVVVAAASPRTFAQSTSAPDEVAGVPLRALADRQNLQVGFAARFNVDELLLDERYRNIVERAFTLVTPEQVMKWNTLRPARDTFDYSALDFLTRFASAQNMSVHGHPLVWHRQNPVWLETLRPELFDAELRNHIDAVMDRYAGQITVYDVINEPVAENGAGLRDTLFLRALGPEYIDTALDTARAADPSATLLINEYDVGWLNDKSDTLYALMDDLLERQIPIDGVGLQMHIDQTFVHAEGFSANMQRFADRGLDIYITEFDVGVSNTDGYARQADLYADVLERCLMQPACRAFQIWGLDDFHSWRPFVDPLPFDDNYDPKPAWFAMGDALSSEAVHLEDCDIGDGQIDEGAVSGTRRIVCRNVALSGGFESVRIRYRNGGLDTPTLRLSGNRQPLVSLELPPVTPTGEGEFRTLRVPLSVISTTADLELLIEGESAELALDALLFTDATQSVLEDRSDPDYTVPIAGESSADPLPVTADDNPEPDADPLAGDSATEDGSAENELPDESGDVNGSSGSGALGGLFFVLLCVAGVRRRCRPARTVAAVQCCGSLYTVKRSDPGCRSTVGN